MAKIYNQQGPTTKSVLWLRKASGYKVHRYSGFRKYSGPFNFCIVDIAMPK